MDRYQPVVIGTDCNGELVWSKVPMERWQMEMFKLHYHGDFSEQWMWMVMHSSGYEWSYSGHDKPDFYEVKQRVRP